MPTSGARPQICSSSIRRRLTRRRQLVHPGLVSMTVGALLLVGAAGVVLSRGVAGAQTADWTVQSSFPPALATLGGIACTSASDCVAVGDDALGDGAVVDTIDGGSTWNAETIPTGTGPLFAVACASSTSCWAVGSDGTFSNGFILATTDGSNWSKQSVPFGSGPLLGIHCTSATSCWAVGTDSSFTYGTVLATTDGSTWIAQSVPSGIGPLAAVTCSSSTACMAAGSDPNEVYGTVISTTDGSNWSNVPLPNGTGPLSGIDCTAGGQCRAAGTDFTDTFGLVVTSSNGGAWTSQNVPNGTGPLADITCTSATDCWAVGADGSDANGDIIATTDGSTWNAQTVPQGTGPLSSVSCVSSSDCWTADAARGSALAGRIKAMSGSTIGAGAFDRTLVAGLHDRLDVGLLSSLRTQSQGHATAVLLAGLPTILGTTDGGTTWNAETPPSAGLASVSSMACANSTTCWAVAIEGNGNQVVLATTDGWSTWSDQSLPTNIGFVESISCPTTSECVAVGGNIGADQQSLVLTPSVVATTDGGATWNTQTIPTTTGLLTGVSCASSTVCEAVGGNIALSGSGESLSPVAIGTTDGGTTWTSQVLPDAASAMNGVSCSSITTCMTVGSTLLPGSVVAVTTDGGATWTDASSGLQDSNLSSVSCPSASACWVAGTSFDGTDAVMAATSDGGATWTSQTLPDGTPPLATVDCPSATSCWAVSANVVIGPIIGGSSLFSIVATGNGGASWSTQSTDSTITGVNALTCPSSSTCWATGETSSAFAVLSMAGVTLTGPGGTTTTTQAPTTTSTAPGSTTSTQPPSTTTTVGGSTTSTPSSATGGSGSATAAGSSSGRGPTVASSSQLAFTGAGGMLEVVAVVGGTLTLLGAFLMLIGADSRLWRRLLAGLARSR